MTISADAPVSVIVAAWNARPTIGRAVASALAQREVAEVIVVDDASTDGTSEIARTADDGTGRLRIIVQPANAGPAAARNAAIRAGSAPLIAILDADDFFVPGRFAPLLAQRGWDAIADNIAFIGETDAAHFDVASIPHFEPDPAVVDLATFVLGNASAPGRPRGELGFAKPVIRRSVLEGARLSYDVRLRLGEDYALYARILAGGARFVRVRSCGYVAVERPNSLSGHHRTDDLAALLDSDLALLAIPTLTPAERAAIGLHAKQLRAKLHHRRMLDIRQARGRWRAIATAFAQPRLLAPLVGAIARDKWPQASPPPPQRIRYLFA